MPRFVCRSSASIARVVVLLDAADAVGHDFVDRLDDAVGRQAAVLDAQIHAAAAGIEADAQLIRGGKLRAELFRQGGRGMALQRDCLAIRENCIG